MSGGSARVGPSQTNSGSRKVRLTGMTQSRPPLPPVVAVTSPTTARIVARCAAELARPALLLCPQEAAAFGGPAWFRELVDAAARQSGAQLFAGLDAGSDAGVAVEALHLRLDVVIFSGPKGATERLQRSGENLGQRVLAKMPSALHVTGRDNLEAACRAWLEQR